MKHKIFGMTKVICVLLLCSAWTWPSIEQSVCVYLWGTAAACVRVCVCGYVCVTFHATWLTCMTLNVSSALRPFPLTLHASLCAFKCVCVCVPWHVLTAYCWPYANDHDLAQGPPMGSASESESSCWARRAACLHVINTFSFVYGSPTTCIL